MRIRFWKRPKYFDFMQHKARQAKLKAEWIGGLILTALGVEGVGVAGSTVSLGFLGTISVSTLSTIIGEVVLTVLMTGLSYGLNAMTAKSGRVGQLASGGLLLYRRGEWR
jgi:hypothetical protein